MQKLAPPNQVFLCNSVYDFELIQSLKVKLGCSQATLYRLLIKVSMPIYHIPHKRSQVLVHGWDLWRIASTAAWKKYLKRRGYKTLGKRQLKHLMKNCVNCDLMDLYYQGWFSPLTPQELMSAVDMGLIPADDHLNLPTWFIACVKGLLNLGLPRKT